MLEADDNVLVPVENMQSMPDGSGWIRYFILCRFRNWLLQLRAFINSVRAASRLFMKLLVSQTFLRGASVASETATAQNIKNQWGTLRLKKMQKEVQRYCREALVIMLEIAASSFEMQRFNK
jgi:hypothetical protein